MLLNLNTTLMQRHLLIFDLDETLVHASSVELQRKADFQISTYFVYQRPFLKQLFAKLSPVYDIAIWSSASREYVDAIVQQLFLGDVETKFVWAVERCIQRVDVRSNSYIYIKDLRKVQRYGYSLNQITMIDDSPEKISRQPRNHFQVKAFLGNDDDVELIMVADSFLDHANCR